MCVDNTRTYLTSDDVAQDVTPYSDGFIIHFNVDILDVDTSGAPTNCEDVFHKVTYDSMGNNLLDDDDKTECYWQSSKELRVIYGTSMALDCLLILNSFKLTKANTSGNFVCPTDILRTVSYPC
jgi:hypothetical protein